jgi:MFS transporter, DHA2 family, multidrug resistance protein
MQNVLGYPILTAGFLLAARGVGTLIAMLMVGRLMKIIEPRYLVLAGMLLATFTLGQMVDFTDQTSPHAIVVVSVVQGFGLGLVFVPLSTVAFATLPGHLRTDGTAILTLVRNLGSSVGISVVIAELTSTASGMHARLAESVTPFNNALAMPDAAMLDLGTDLGRATMDRLLTQQATIIAYANDFKLLMYLTLATIPLVFVIGVARARPATPIEPPAPAH